MILEHNLSTKEFLVNETLVTKYLTVLRQLCSIPRDSHFSLCLCGGQTVTAGSSSQEKDKTSDGDTNGPSGEPEKSHSNSSTLSDRRPSDSSLCSIEEEHRYVYDMVQNILLSTRDNVNFVNEVFHQVLWVTKEYVFIRCKNYLDCRHFIVYVWDHVYNDVYTTVTFTLLPSTGHLLKLLKYKITFIYCIYMATIWNNSKHRIRLIQKSIFFLLRLFCCRPAKHQQPGKWSKCTGNGSYRRSPASWQSLTEPPRKMKWTTGLNRYSAQSQTAYTHR